jgi:hypothetical protein
VKLRLKPIPGFAGYYADQTGAIWSAQPSRWGHVKWIQRKTATGRDGYEDIVLKRSNGRRANKAVHSLVAAAFFGARPHGLVTTHLNGDKRDNRVANLAYRTTLDNSLDKRAHGTMVRGDIHPNSKLTDAQVLEMFRMLASGVTQRAVALHFGINPTTVWAMKTGRLRAHLSTAIH